MLIKYCIYCISIIISILSIPSLIYSIKNKNKNISKWIIRINLLYIIYLLAMYIVLDALSIPVGLELLYINFIVIVGIIIYFISIIINALKKKKLKKNEKSNKVVIVSIILLIIPVLLTVIFIIENKKIINNSELIVVYKSNGNGGFGDGTYFAYGIGKDYCKEFDLGIDIGGYSLRKFLSTNAVEIDNLEEISNYTITFVEDDIIVKNKDKKICQQRTKSHYSNIDFNKAFYSNK